jgi:uncharacterized protein (TIGR02145 family)
MISFLPFNQNNSALDRMFRLCLVLLVVISTSCSKEFINPYDPATRADEWMPRDLNIDTVDLGTLRISWTQDIKHIDGYFLRKTINGWPIVIELPGEATSYIDTVINNLEGELRYSLRAKAGNRLSDSLLADDDINVPFFIVGDLDGNFYRIVDIGNQTWMEENLRTSRYSNGDPILNFIIPSEWTETTLGAWCSYENNPAFEKQYGKLYNFNVVMDSRNLCPIDWHIPSIEEWSELADYLGGESIAGGKLKSTYGWMEPNIGASNETGFSALPGGYRGSGPFYFAELIGYWWSSSETGTTNALVSYISNNSATLFSGSVSRTRGHAIRCIKN